MYHFFVRRAVRRTFEQIEAGDYEALLRGYAPGAAQTFFGQHPLGGTRHTTASLRRWYERLFALLPELRFDLRQIIVQGGPWDTTVAVEWRDRARPRDGQPYDNEGVHVIRLRWGRVRDMRIYCDTQKIDRVCSRLARHGIREAAAPPIID